MIEGTTYNKADNFKGAVGGRWLPGQSGNVNGRVPGSLTTLLKEYLEQGNNKAHKEEIIEALVVLAKSTGVQGQVAAIKEIFERIDGKVVDKRLTVNVAATPESLMEAQQRLLQAKDDEERLLEKFDHTA